MSVYDYLVNNVYLGFWAMKSDSAQYLLLKIYVRNITEKGDQILPWVFNSKT